jgi:inorganic phosphate transporter, PiT family
MLLIVAVLLAALLFEYLNGFHDTANAIATIVATKVLTPRQAIVLAATCDLLGALAGTAVASTVATGLVDLKVVTMTTLLCALLAAVAWNLLTWWYGLPSSSSHALIGGLCGAALASGHNNWSVIKWSTLNPATHLPTGVWPKVVLPMIVAPGVGILSGFVLMTLFMVLLRGWKPMLAKTVFGRLQWVSASWMSFGHGLNDAQKTMGIIALTLFTATQGGHFDHLPNGLQFLRLPAFGIPTWVKVVCAITLACGTATGGWRIIRTVGHRVVKLHTVEGFVAQSSAASVIQAASLMGIPLSTTHVVSTCIMGVGATKGLKAIQWTTVESMLWTWVLTLPVTGLHGYGLLCLARTGGICP